MIGAILGDIVGSIYEFDNIKTKEFELFDKECSFTDDTVMTIAVAEAQGVTDVFCTSQTAIPRKTDRDTWKRLKISRPGL